MTRQNSVYIILRSLIYQFIKVTCFAGNIYLAMTTVIKKSYITYIIFCIFGIHHFFLLSEQGICEKHVFQNQGPNVCSIQKMQTFLW